MPEFFSCHKLAETDRETMRRRAEKLAAGATDDPVELVRTVCDLQAGRMLCEWIAHNRDEVLGYLDEHELTLRDECEWLIHVDLEEPPASPPINPEPD